MSFLTLSLCLLTGLMFLLICRIWLSNNPPAPTKNKPVATEVPLLETERLELNDQGYIQCNLLSDSYEVDDNWLNFSGYSRSELPLSTSELDRTILHPDDREQICTATETATSVTGTDRFSSDYRMLHASGRWIWVRSSMLIIRDESGLPTHLLAKQVDITEQKTTENILRNSQVFAGLREFIFEDGLINITTLEPGKVGLVVPEQWVQFGIEEAIHPDDLAMVRQVLSQSSLSHRPFEIEFRAFTRDRRLLNILLYGQPETDADGKFSRIRGVFRDITARKLAQSREKTYRLLIEGSCTGLVITRISDLAVLHVNQKFCTDSGFTVEEALTLSTEKLISEWNYDKVKKLLSTLLNAPEEQQQWSYQSGNVKRKDGSTFPVKVWSHATQWEGEAVFATVVLDISEQQQLQQALADSEQKYRQLFDALPDSVILFDEDSIIIDCNQETANSHGWSRDELIGQPVAVLSPTPGEIDVVEILKKQGELAVDGIETHRDGTEMPVESHAKMISIGDRPVMVAVLRDVAERLHFIDEIQRQKTEMEEFTYTVSHDLKSPLTTIAGFSEVLAESLEGNDIEAAKNDLKRISRAATKMQNLLGELLEYSRLGVLPNSIESAPMREIIDDAQERVAGQILESGATITVQPDQPDQPEVEGNLLRITQLYQNLIDNAIKFHHRDRPIQIDLGWDTKKSCFFVDDNGPGIEPQFNKKIFELFDQLDHDHSGSGIGLAAAKKIVETHGGTIWMESPSALGGTRFNFTLQNAKKALN